MYWVQWFLAMYGVTEFLTWLHPDYSRGEVLEAAMLHIPAVTALDIPTTFTLMEVLQRLMTTYNYLMNKHVRPLQEKLREEGREEGRAEGKAAGRAQAASEFRQLVGEWNERRLAAAARNEPFDEPIPLPGDDEPPTG